MVRGLLDDASYGENWAKYWRDVVLYRRSENRALLVAPTLTRYLAEQFNQNVPWDQIAASFVTARGDVRQRGDTAIIMAQAGRPEETVAEISRIFLGIQIQCAQCHDHFTDRWTREQFHELAAFFPRVSLRPVRDREPPSFAVIGSDVAPKKRRQMDRYLGQSEHYMTDLEDPAAPGTRMTPKFFLGDQSLELGSTDRERRMALAAWITAPENPWFAKALVNRLWSELIGAGFFPAPDDIGPDRSPVAPLALEFLAQDFTAHGYDLKRLFQVMMLTDTYQLPSRSRALQGPADFRSVYPQRLRSDQLFQALTGIFDLPRSPRFGPKAARLGPAGRNRDPSLGFATVFGFDPSDPRDQIGGSLPQALLMMNSQVLNQLIGAERAFGLGQLLREFPDNRELVQELYLRTLSRPPDPRELAFAIAHLRKSSPRATAAEDLLWALMNSTEFSYRT
jgi:hypothetical protein